MTTNHSDAGLRKNPAGSRTPGKEDLGTADDPRSDSPSRKGAFPDDSTSTKVSFARDGHAAVTRHDRVARTDHRRPGPDRAPCLGPSHRPDSVGYGGQDLRRLHGRQPEHQDHPRGVQHGPDAPNSQY